MRDALRDTGCLGSVSLIALLFFITQGELPIYDRYAEIALKAIAGNIRPGQEVRYAELPGKNDTASEIWKSRIQPYINTLEMFFGDEWERNRDIDRALWVYGHLFGPI